MAGDDDTQTTEGAKPTAAERRRAAQEGEQRAPRFTRADVEARPGLLEDEFPRWLLVAAFEHAEVDGEDEMTASEIRKHVERFLKREDETEREV